MFVKQPQVEKLFEVKNEEYGISANIIESPNPKYKYRLIFMDDDAVKSVSVVFGDNYDRFVERALEFVKEY
jgi:hypothetical protein